MAFGDELKPNWAQIIKSAMIDAGLKPHRVDATIIPGTSTFARVHFISQLYPQGFQYFRL